MFDNLNTEQQKAVRHTQGPLLILAGAGSGKTKALTHRIAYLIVEKKVHPSNILAVTFTNKAANEMKERIGNLLRQYAGKEKILEPVVGTFHSVCVRILKREAHNLGYENNFVIYDTSDTEALMKRIIKQQELDEKQYNPKSILTHISRAKNNLIDEQAYKNTVDSFFEEQVAKIYPIYQKELQKSQAFDFDDLIMRTILLFQKQPHILEKYQEQFHYICVDEYQDTNYAQYLLAKMLAEKYRNICVIGDDWQSIYSWRGADMQNILNFQKDYPDASVIKLEQNYRSTKVIVDAANHVIKNNKRRTEKTLWTEKENNEKISVLEASDERDEGEKIITMIRNQRKQNENLIYNDFSILYRTNAQSRMMEENFLRHGIPYKIIGSVNFYQRKEIKDMISYLKVIHNPSDTISLLRIINTPTRGIGDQSLQILAEYAIKYDLTLFETIHRSVDILELGNKVKLNLKNFYDMMVEFQKKNQEYPAGALLRYVMNVSEYKDFLLDGTPEGEERYKNVEELVSVASKYDALEPGVSLATFLEEVALVSQVDELEKKQEDGVVMMTLHNAKGLEFPYVFMIGLEEGIFPHSQSQWTQDELEEERRLMYVGITRAKEKLYLVHAKSRLLYGSYQNNVPSRFIFEIPEQYLEFVYKKDNAAVSNPTTFRDIIKAPILHTFKDGEKVKHATWGEGIIVQIQGDLATVAFKKKEIGIKKLALNIAPLEKI